MKIKTRKKGSVFVKTIYTYYHPVYTLFQHISIYLMYIIYIHFLKQRLNPETESTMTEDLVGAKPKRNINKKHIFLVKPSKTGRSWI